MRLTEDGVNEQKSRILQAAFRVFADVGFEAAKMEDIAKLAGVSRSPLYYHFNNKYRLFIEMFKNYCEIYTTDAARCLSQEGDFFQKIENLLRFFRTEFNTGAGKISADVLGNIQGLEEARGYEIKVRKTVYGLLIKQIEEAIKDGTLISDADPIIIGDMIHLWGEGLNSAGLGLMRVEYDGITMEESYATKKHIGTKYEDILIKESIKMLKRSFGANHENSTE